MDLNPNNIAWLLRDLNVDGYLDDGALVEATNRFGTYLKSKDPGFNFDRFYFIAVDS